MTKTFRPSRFSIDGGDSFPGFTCGDSWNGWACPAFEREAALQIAALPGWNVEYDEAGDAFVYTDEGYDQAERYPATAITLADGSTRTVYAIGAYSWVWDEEAPAASEAEEKALCDLLTLWCARQGLQARSADEMLRETSLSPEQRQWLSAFVLLWDQTVD